MNKSLRGLLLLSPFIQFLFIGKPIATTLALFGISSVFFVFLLFLISEKEYQKITFPYLWLWAFAQTIYYNRFGAEKDLDISLIYLIHISIFFILYFAVAQSKVDYEYILKPLTYACIITSIFSIFQKFGIEQFKFDIFWGRVIGTLANPTNTAMYIAATSPFLLFYKRGWFYLIVPLIAILIIGSASAVLGIVAAILAVFILKRQYIKLATSLCLLGVGIYKLADSHFFLTYDKLELWNMAIKDWMNNAWFGYGLGHFARRYTTPDGFSSWAYMHNHYLYILYTLGVIGLFFLVLFLMPIFKKHQKVLPFASVISVLVMGLCSIPMRVYPIVLLTAFNLAVLTKKEENKCEKLLY